MKIFVPIAGSAVKNLPSKAGDEGGKGLIPGSGRSPGGGNGNQLEYWTEEPGGLQSMGSQRVKHDLATEHNDHRG